MGLACMRSRVACWGATLRIAPHAASSNAEQVSAGGQHASLGAGVPLRAWCGEAKASADCGAPAGQLRSSACISGEEEAASIRASSSTLPTAGMHSCLRWRARPRAALWQQHCADAADVTASSVGSPRHPRLLRQGTIPRSCTHGRASCWAAAWPRRHSHHEAVLGSQQQRSASSVPWQWRSLDAPSGKSGSGEAGAPEQHGDGPAGPKPQGGSRWRSQEPGQLLRRPQPSGPAGPPRPRYAPLQWDEEPRTRPRPHPLQWDDVPPAGRGMPPYRGNPADSGSRPWPADSQRQQQGRAAPGALNGAARPASRPLDWGGPGPPRPMRPPPFQTPPGGLAPQPPPPAKRARAEGELPAEAEVRLVFGDGEHKVMPYAAAVRQAERAGQDLLSVAPGARPPVFKLGHADAAAAAERAREKESRKREVQLRRKHTLKEVRVGPKTAAHDLEVKLRQARGFVERGYRVKAAVPFRAPERAAAADMLRRLREAGAEFAAVADPAVNERLARNTVAIYLSPPH